MYSQSCLCVDVGRVVGQAMIDHMDVRKIGFTGSTGIGKTIMKSVAESNVKKVSLELGGKSPLIIFGDCDLDKAVRLANKNITAKSKLLLWLINNYYRVHSQCSELHSSRYVQLKLFFVLPFSLVPRPTHHFR